MAPSAKATGQLMPGTTRRATAATATVVATTSPTARSRMGRRLAVNSRREVKYAAAQSTGGRKTRKTRSGSRRHHRHRRHEAQREPAQHEQDRVRDEHAAREGHEEEHRDQQEDDDLEVIGRRSSHVLRPDAEPDQPGGDPAKITVAADQSQRGAEVAAPGPRRPGTDRMTPALNRATCKRLDHARRRSSRRRCTRASSAPRRPPLAERRGQEVVRPPPRPGSPG